MKPSSSVAVALSLFVAAALLSSRAPTAVSVACDPMQLTPCASAILSAARPTGACCAKLEEQKPCFCEYKKNPKLQGYINSANGRRVAGDCHVPMPKCTS